MARAAESMCGGSCRTAPERAARAADSVWGGFCRTAPERAVRAADSVWGGSCRTAPERAARAPTQCGVAPVAQHLRERPERLNMNSPLTLIVTHYSPLSPHCVSFLLHYHPALECYCRALECTKIILTLPENHRTLLLESPHTVFCCKFTTTHHSPLIFC